MLSLKGKNKKENNEKKGQKQGENKRKQLEQEHFYNSNNKYEHLLPTWICYQAIVLNDQQVRSISLVPLLTYLNDAP